ncbi:hypothetical protein Xbud_03850 [Xenorhabdus budapestensis]|uniref:Uncharacterized protein n=1 Tax=Xenorhabdus budapestensis TaxID=290110 RepID=A0A2D0IJI6_XENBU|nr:hypothetical protein Xbud_03850 [Xenorhabdus budapestensis]
MYNSKLLPLLFMCHSYATCAAMIGYFNVYLQWNLIVSIILSVMITCFFSRAGIDTLLGILGAVNV